MFTFRADKRARDKYRSPSPFAVAVVVVCVKGVIRAQRGSLKQSFSKSQSRGLETRRRQLEVSGTR